MASHESRFQRDIEAYTSRRQSELETGEIDLPLELKTETLLHVSFAEIDKWTGNRLMLDIMMSFPFIREYLKQELYYGDYATEYTNAPAEGWQFKHPVHAWKTSPFYLIYLFFKLGVHRRPDILPKVVSWHMSSELISYAADGIAELFKIGKTTLAKLAVKYLINSGYISGVHTFAEDEEAEAAIEQAEAEGYDGNYEDSEEYVNKFGHAFEYGVIDRLHWGPSSGLGFGENMPLRKYLLYKAVANYSPLFYTEMTRIIVKNEGEWLVGIRSWEKVIRGSEKEENKQATKKQQKKEEKLAMQWIKEQTCKSLFNILRVYNNTDILIIPDAQPGVFIGEDYDFAPYYNFVDYLHDNELIDPWDDIDAKLAHVSEGREVLYLHGLYEYVDWDAYDDVDGFNALLNAHYYAIMAKFTVGGNILTPRQIISLMPRYAPP